MLKSDSSKKESAVQKATIKAELEKDLINYDIIKKFLTIYLATVAIPNFKRFFNDNDLDWVFKSFSA